MLSEPAPAKLNLALHVRARRPDGYHELETLFAFCGDGDILAVEPASADTLSIDGPFAAGLSAQDNLVRAVVAAMREFSPGKVPPLEIRLTKNLPVAAGLGGGSADAAAMIRLLDRHFVRSGDPALLAKATAHLGADVSACLLGQTSIGHGIGDSLGPAPDDLADTPALLVNPRTPLSTGQVFQAWDGQDRGSLTVSGTARAIALGGRNDLTVPAIGLCPLIADVLGALDQTPAWLARMSGSGATCFALYESSADRDVAVKELAHHHPHWWVFPTALA